MTKYFCFSLLSEIDEFDQISSSKEPFKRVDSISRQCSPVLLSPASTEVRSHNIIDQSEGFILNMDQSQARDCSSLLCLACNLGVVRADNMSWDEGTDYLFLRNNVPDMSKLRGRSNGKPKTEPRQQSKVQIL